MNKGVVIILILVAVGIVAFMTLFDADMQGGALPDASVDVTQTEEGQLPNYEIRKTQEGNMPEYDVDADMRGGEMPEVDVQAPEVDVETETREVEVPTGIDVDPAEDR